MWMVTDVYEIIYGSCAIDHDGKGLYSTRMGHGDAMHLTQICSRIKRFAGLGLS